MPAPPSRVLGLAAVLLTAPAAASLPASGHFGLGSAPQHPFPVLNRDAGKVPVAELTCFSPERIATLNAPDAVLGSVAQLNLAAGAEGLRQAG